MKIAVKIIGVLDVCQLRCHYENQYTKCDGQISKLFFNNKYECFLRRADLRESMVFYNFFSRLMFAWMFSAETRPLIHFLAQFGGRANGGTSVHF